MLYVVIKEIAFSAVLFPWQKNTYRSPNVGLWLAVLIVAVCLSYPTPACGGWLLCT